MIRSIYTAFDQCQVDIYTSIASGRLTYLLPNVAAMCTSLLAKSTSLSIRKFAKVGLFLKVMSM